MMVIKGDKFIEIGTKELFKNYDFDNKEKFKISGINYDKTVNKEFEHSIMGQITHDGTLIFTYNKMIEMFYQLIKNKIQYETLMDIEDVECNIGDLTIKSRKISKISEDKQFPGVQEVFELPICYRTKVHVNQKTLR